MNLPIHAGEEILYAVIPFFIFMVIANILKKRRAKREEAEKAKE